MPTLIEIAQTVATGGAATAVIVVVRMFLSHLREERADRDRSREQFLEVITNDLAHQTQAVTDLTTVIAELNARLRVAGLIDRRVASTEGGAPREEYRRNTHHRDTEGERHEHPISNIQHRTFNVQVMKALNPEP